MEEGKDGKRPSQPMPFRASRRCIRGRIVLFPDQLDAELGIDIFGTAESSEPDPSMHDRSDEELRAKYEAIEEQLRKKKAKEPPARKPFNIVTDVPPPFNVDDLTLDSLLDLSLESSDPTTADAEKPPPGCFTSTPKKTVEDADTDTECEVSSDSNDDETWGSLTSLESFHGISLSTIQEETEVEERSSARAASGSVHGRRSGRSRLSIQIPVSVTAEYVVEEASGVAVPGDQNVDEASDAAAEGGRNARESMAYGGEGQLESDRELLDVTTANDAPLPAVLRIEHFRSPPPRLPSPAHDAGTTPAAHDAVATPAAHDAVATPAAHDAVATPAAHVAAASPASQPAQPPAKPKRRTTGNRYGTAIGEGLGLRRSCRNRALPTRTWMGEYPVYKCSSDGLLEMVNVTTVLPVVTERRSSTSARSRVRSLGPALRRNTEAIRAVRVIKRTQKST